MNKLGSNMTKYLAVPITGLGGVLSKMGLDFEQSFAKVSTLLDSNVVNFEQYKKSLLQASSEAKVEVNDFSEAVYSSISAGVDQTRAIEFTTGAMKLARGGFTSGAKAVDVMTTAINGYKLKTEDANKISDLLINTQNLGKTTVDELASSMGAVIPIASGANFNIEELSASYALLTKNGVATAMSGTYMKSMLNELTKSGSITDKALKKLSGKGFAELKAEGKSTTEILGMLDKEAKANGMTLKDMFGSVEAGTAAMMIGNEGGAEYNEMLESMKNSAGATQEAVDKIDASPLEKMKDSMNKLKNAGIEFGQLLIPTFEKVANKISVFSEKVANLSPKQKEFVINIGKAILIMTGVIVVLGKLFQAIILFNKVNKIIKGISIAGKALSMGMLGGIALAIVAIVVLVTLIVTNWEKIKEVTLNIWNSIKEFFINTWNSIATSVSEFVTKIKDKLINDWTYIKNRTSEIWEEVKTALVDKFNSIKAKVVEIFTAIGDFILNIWNGIKTAIQVVILAIKFIIETVFTLLVTIIRIPLEIIRAIVVTIWNFIGESVMKVVTAIVDFVKLAWEKLIIITSTIIMGIHDIITTIWNAIYSFISAIITTIVDFIKERWDAIYSAIASVLTAIWAVISSVWNKVVEVTMTIWNAIYNYVAGIVTAVWGKITEIWTSIYNTTMEKWNSIKETIQNVWSRIKEGVASSIASVRDTVSNIWDNIKSATQEKWNSIKESITTPINSAKEGVREAIEAIKGFFNKLKLKFPQIEMPRLPHFKLDGEFSLKNMTVPKLNVDWYSEGGIFTKRTVLPNGIGVGDANNGFGDNAEAVLPINKLSGIMAETMKSLGYASEQKDDESNNTIINFYGNYGFKDKEDMDYLMNQFALKVKGVR